MSKFMENKVIIPSYLVPKVNHKDIDIKRAIVKKNKVGFIRTAGYFKKY